MIMFRVETIDGDVDYYPVNHTNCVSYGSSLMVSRFFLESRYPKYRLNDLKVIFVIEAGD